MSDEMKTAMEQLIETNNKLIMESSITEFASRLIEKGRPVTREDILDEMAFYVGHDGVLRFIYENEAD